MSILTGLIGTVTGLKWKIGTVVAGVGLLAASGALVVAHINEAALTKQNLALDARIDDPKTGYIVRLAQADTNTTTCKSAVLQRDAVIQKQSADSLANNAAIQARFDTEHAARIVAERQVGAFLAHKPTGATVQDRVMDVDAQILGDLK